jgi:hypothetical protein
MRRLMRDSALWRAFVAVAAAGLVLAGCGGGGGGGEPAAPTTVTILDSFGQPVGSDAGIGDGDSGADGTAGEGKPIVGGVVVITDSAGRTASATTDNRGYYRVKVTGFSAPFVAKVTAPGGAVYHSLNVKPVVRNGFVTVNLTGLTDKVASDVARAAGRSGAAELTPAMVGANGAAITASVDALRTQLASVISAAGIAPASFDPLAAPFRADHTGYDYVLDNVVVVRGADGATTVAVSPSFQPPGGTPGLTGTWELRIEEAGESFVAGQFPASAVPTQETIGQFSNAFFQGITSFDNADGKTVTVSGNTATITGPNTNYTVHLDQMTVTNFQGCGACGVGSQVAITVNTVFTESGLWEGQQSPAQTFNETFNLRYVRVN